MESLVYPAENDLEIFVNEDNFVVLRSEPDGYDTQIVAFSMHRLPIVISYLQECLKQYRTAQPEK